MTGTSTTPATPCSARRACRPTELERGYHWAYREFYRWKSIVRGASAHGDLMAGLRHLAYSAGWKKFEPLWDFIIRARRAGTMLPVLETILSEFGRRAPESAIRPDRSTTRPHDEQADAVHLPSTQLIQIQPRAVGESVVSARVSIAENPGRFTFVG